MKTFKTVLIYIIALVITLAAVVFQRMTGPTYPYKETITLNGVSYKIKLPRSLDTKDKSPIQISLPSKNIQGQVQYRIYPSDIPFMVNTLKTSAQGLEFALPVQNAAGKIEYRIILTESNDVYESPYLVVRYKDSVPAIWLIPHIILMFAVMFIAVVAGLMAIFKHGNYVRMLLWSGILLFIGGMVFGCIVQKYAFGTFWSGIPFGWDLTDNKTLFTLLIFAFAIYRNHKKASRLWTIAATVSLLLIYSIPHSVMGSELDPKTGKMRHASETRCIESQT